MCGIAGIVCLEDYPSDVDLRREVGRMGDSLSHRGPDAKGIWVGDSFEVALAHQRLSIVDLSREGHQPMMSTNGRYVISYNGEVYNFLELKEELTKRGHLFRGRSDTEVVLAAICEWGLEEAVNRFVGMFAIGLWDKTEECLYLIRDRLGKKPLYYSMANGRCVFASELKAISTSDEFKGEMNKGALKIFLRYGYLLGPHTIYENVFKLPPGAILQVSRNSHAVPKLNLYWSSIDVAQRNMKNPFIGDLETAVSQLESVLTEAVHQRMISDVPLGSFLSGGVDSSVVVALMQSLNDGPVRTFTMGFEEEKYNETKYAKEVAEHLGTEHTEFYVTPDEAIAVIERLPFLYSEPFGDPSQIPTFLLANLARKHVKVALSGDGGDEIFGGYPHYQFTERIWSGVGWMPRKIRQWVGRGLQVPSPSIWDFMLDRGKAKKFRSLRGGSPGDRVHKLGQLLESNSSQDLYSSLVSKCKNPTNLLNAPHELVTDFSNDVIWGASEDLTHRMMLMDTMTYLPDDILVKIDRASMAVGLEVRSPILDQRVMEFSWRLPVHMKVANHERKLILKKLLYRYVPESLVNRPKMGFGVPVGEWIRGPLKDWAETLLDEERLRKEKFFKPEPIRRIWRQHLTGERNWQACLWNILMFQQWIGVNKDSLSADAV